MKIKVNFKFDEKYLPPRCRKYRTRTVDGQAEVFVKETIKEKAPIACIVHDGWDFYADPMPDGHYPKKVYDVRLYDGQMYKRKLARDWVAKGKGYATVEQLAKHINWCANVKWSDDFEGRVKAAQEDADGFLIMDGEVLVKCGEPMYLVMTFGLGHNHGGTAGFIEHYYNGNISKDNYFNAKDRDKAVAYGKEVARRRGDTKFVDGIFQYEFIDVKIPEAFKADPQKEHGDGDPFMNLLQEIIDGSESQGEAAVGVMAATLLEVRK